jgi:hypothetical protein
MESTKDTGSKIKRADNKDSNPNSPFTSEFSQEQAITTNSGPARIEKFIARLPKGLRKKTTNCPDKTDAA